MTLISIYFRDFKMQLSCQMMRAVAKQYPDNFDIWTTKFLNFFTFN